MENITIRSIRPEDIGKTAGMCVRSFVDEGIKFDPHSEHIYLLHSYNWFKREISEGVLLEKFTSFYVAEADGQIVGCGGLEKLGSGDNIELKVRVLFTDPAYKRKGIGSAIIQKVVEDARPLSEDGYLYLDSTRFDSVIHWYSNRGFERVNPFDINERRPLMRKKLR